MEEEKVEVIVEEEEKKTLKQRFVGWCKEHPDVILTVAGGIASIIGGCIKLYASKSEYEDNLFTTVDDQVYKIPAKQMKTATYTTTNKEG